MRYFLIKVLSASLALGLLVMMGAFAVMAQVSDNVPQRGVDWNSIPYEGPVQLTPEERTVRSQRNQQLMEACTQQVIKVGETVFVIDGNTRSDVLQMLEDVLSNDTNCSWIPVWISFGAVRFPGHMCVSCGRNIVLTMDFS